MIQATARVTPTYFCSSAAVDITPVKPVPLAGYSGHRIWRTGSTPLEANAVFLTDGRSQVLFISVDLLYCGSELTNHVMQCAAEFGLREGDVILAASHTHFAPATDRNKPLLGVVDDGYMRHLTDCLSELVAKTLTHPRVPVLIRSAVGEVPLNVNRRRLWRWPTWTRKGLTLAPTIVMAPAPQAPRDTLLDAIRLDGLDGTTRAVLWKYACHPVCAPESHGISAEYPGYARERLRATTRELTPVVFLQGFAGDVRPNLRGTPTARARLAALRRGPGFFRVRQDDWHRWLDSLCEAFVSVTRRAEMRLDSEWLMIQHSEVPIDALLDVAINAHLRDKRLRLQRVAFGSCLEMVFISAEVCTPYVALLHQGMRSIFASCTGDVFGYLPSESQAIEGGYEGGDFFRAFGLHGHFRRGFQQAVLDAASQLRSGDSLAHSRSSSMG